MNSLDLLTENLSSIASVRTESLLPKQQKAARKILRSADCYQQKFIKFPHIGIFHSYAELLYAALLESDKDVSVFVPQPFLLYIGNRQYIPDCYFVKFGQRKIIEIKPNGEMKDELRIPLEEYFSQERINFDVISNEEILTKERLALNWLKIIRILISATHENTFDEEVKIQNQLIENSELELGDVIFIGDRIGQRKTEIAIFRLAHKGKLKLDLSDSVLNYYTRVTLCI